MIKTFSLEDQIFFSQELYVRVSGVKQLLNFSYS